MNRAIRKKLDTYQPNEIIADVLRIFGPGMKVIFEMAMMAADAGLIEIGKPVFAIAGYSPWRRYSSSSISGKLGKLF